ncbi:hypothetical protein CIHG_00284 [Coccidioides immitis H538.4]|uniref:Uncharacterized protein n=3 Tax=Coccidioides immitis TaxID=5501 RepID=A0A0J8QLS8_COCIT|nr:hypothetical protein CIRG_07104 [Coccidioides immitis RMSCC 2394]KMU72123.1 hypothetical protein CISG_00432 [Coccidioides immitis RMSCC 3703]KMU82502.1 hypothetical protein CIHG_00284 [Coccidioides immitis H538.4]
MTREKPRGKAVMPTSFRAASTARAPDNFSLLTRISAPRPRDLGSDLPGAFPSNRLWDRGSVCEASTKLLVQVITSNPGRGGAAFFDRDERRCLSFQRFRRRVKSMRGPNFSYCPIPGQSGKPL